MLSFSLLFIGYLSDTVGPFLSGSTLRSECAVACVNNANCSSFFYDVNTQACYLEKYVYVAMDQLYHQRGVQYYSLLNEACPAGYVYCRFTNQCLRLHSSSKMKYPAAKTLCLENSGHLAFIMAKEENEQASVVAENNTVWIGLERNDGDDEWHWANGHSLGPYINFNQASLEDEQIYGRMFPLGKWGAYSANGVLFTLCEIGVEGKSNALMCWDINS
ncbi:collectin-12-like [Haliotis asinina]|uniref:collectin-12-like n=1 Tax=Haliotis asinina TaxID=109174 RepID=UPI0035320900